MPFDRSLPDSRADRWIRFVPAADDCVGLRVPYYYRVRAAQYLFYAFGEEWRLITHHKDKAALTMMSMETVIETDFQVVRPDMDLAEMVKAISKSGRNLFPVVDVRNELIGLVILNDIRNIMFRQELYHKYRVENFMVNSKSLHYYDRFNGRRDG